MADDTPSPIRIGDAERDEATAALGEHFAAGRLTAEEFEERLGQVAAARYRDDLIGAFDELPAPRFGSAGNTREVRTTGAATESRPDRADAGPDARFFVISGGLALIAFFICGFALGGWAWAWLFFLLPGIVGVALYGDDYLEGRRRYRARRNEYRRHRHH